MIVGRKIFFETLIIVRISSGVGVRIGVSAGIGIGSRDCILQR